MNYTFYHMPVAIFLENVLQEDTSAPVIDDPYSCKT